MFVAGLSGFTVLLTVVLLVLGYGVRLNLAANSAGLLTAQWWAWLLSGCAIVGRCM